MPSPLARRLRRLAACALAVTTVSGPALSQTPQEMILEGQFRQRLRALADSTHGIVGVAALDLVTGRYVGINDSSTFPQGSAIKIPLLIELFRQLDDGSLRNADRIPVRASDQVAGSGVAQWFADGESALSVHDLAVLMINLSDNTATNILVDRVGGFTAINRTMATLGVGDIRFQRKMIQELESARGNENVATPRAAATLMGRLAACDLPMSRARCQQVRRILELPKAGAIPASVPPGVRTAWKPGSVEGVRTAWGLVDLPGRPYVVVGMVTYADDDEAGRVLRAVADAAYEYYRRLARASAFGVRVPLRLNDSIPRRPRVP